MADSPTEAHEMTPEDQNRDNSEADDIKNILGGFMEAEEETLEELIGGMMYLSMDDVKKLGKKAAPPAVQLNPHRERSTVRAIEGKVEGLDSGSQPHSTSATASNPSGDAEDIEEEFLDDCQASKQRTDESLFRHRPGSLTKFDNFVTLAEGTEPDAIRDDPCDDGDKDDDWLPSSGYMASFAGGEAATQQDTEKQGMSETGLDQNLNKDSSPSTALVEDTKCLQSKPDVTPASESTAAACKNVSILDLKVWESEPDDTSTVCEDDVETPPWPVNPGEVEEEGEEVEGEAGVQVKQNVNVMEFSMKVVSVMDAGESTEKARDAQDCSDEVVAFTLEEDFDYNSVPYTPKFTQAEMNYLTSFVPQNSS
ncbi:uncharacterized protein [Littorina saxatilis]|uniref:Uncharacterized protein n=1 Tax=Littorina saxatilis TaxID=31220 RepID=A0AAN9B5D1_9CAEN